MYNETILGQYHAKFLIKYGKIPKSKYPKNKKWTLEERLTYFTILVDLFLINYTGSDMTNDTYKELRKGTNENYYMVEKSYSNKFDMNIVNHALSWEEVPCIPECPSNCDCEDDCDCLVKCQCGKYYNNIERFLINGQK